MPYVGAPTTRSVTLTVNRAPFSARAGWSACPTAPLACTRRWRGALCTAAPTTTAAALACEAVTSLRASCRLYGSSSFTPRSVGRSASQKTPPRQPGKTAPAASRDEPANTDGGQEEEDDWSSIEVEVLSPDMVLPGPTGGAALFEGSTNATHHPSENVSHGAEAFEVKLSGPSTSSNPDTFTVVDAVDAYAKAKVMNFIRRLQPNAGGHDGGVAGACASSSSAAAATGSSGSSSAGSIVGMEVREVQGSGHGGTQFHARWRLPFPSEYGDRYGEGIAATAKEAEAVAAMHAERVIDALGFPLFLLSSKQRKHAEAARAAGRWAPMPAATTSSSSAGSLSSAELIPPPHTPSPPPLRLQHMSARQVQERELRIEHVKFTPVEKRGVSSLSCTLASPFVYDYASVRRIQFFFAAHRRSFRAGLNIFQLNAGKGATASANAERGEGPPPQPDGSDDASLYLAKITLPAPPRFGIRTAMGKAPVKKEAITLACMHAELIIDTIGMALYPNDRAKQTTHAMECARVRRWCAPPGDCDYRYSATSPPPLELAERGDGGRAAAEGTPMSSSFMSQDTMQSFGGGRYAADANLCEGQAPRDTATTAASTLNDAPFHGDENDAFLPNADIQVGRSSSDSVESLLLQHHKAVRAAVRFADETRMRDYENGKLLLERYLEQFVPRTASTAQGIASGSSQDIQSTETPSRSAVDVSPLLSLMFVEKLGQRDRAICRATITVPLTDEEPQERSAISEPVAVAAAAAPLRERDTDTSTATPPSPASATTAPLPYTQSFVAIGISDTPHIAELAAALHALRTLAVLNRLTLKHGNASVQQALESFALRAKLPLYRSGRAMLYPSAVSTAELPAPVRVMEGVIGRIISSGLNFAQKHARAQVFMPGAVVQSNAQARRAIISTSDNFHALQLLNREEFLLQELSQARARVPRLDWDVTPDIEDRIIIAPDADTHMARQYTHTLSSVRNPDELAVQRIQDYLERHGKSRGMIFTVTRTRAPEPDSSPEAPMHYVATLVLPIPQFHLRRTRTVGAAGSAATASTAEGIDTNSVPSKEAAEPFSAAAKEDRHDDAAGATAPPPHSSENGNSTSSGNTSATLPLYTARGEAPTPKEACLLCAAHAELLLDALGLPLYDHPVLQRQHADAARALGRWAPLVRGGLMAPATLRPMPPPLRKVTRESVTWARVQRERAAAEAAEHLTKAVSGEDATTATGGAGAAAAEEEVSDEVLCDISKLSYVDNTGIYFNAVRHAARFFMMKGSDFHRATRQYKVADPKYGHVHRAIVRLPIAPHYGPRYAIGVADTKRNALHLCAQHAIHILDALHVRVHTSAAMQRRYSRLGAVRGVRATRDTDGLAAADTPSPPGYYSLLRSEAAQEQMPSIPRPPAIHSSSALEELKWKTYVKNSASYATRSRRCRLIQTVTRDENVPSMPPSGVPVEDTAYNAIVAQPVERSALRQLTNLCRQVGLTNPLPDDTPYEKVTLPPPKQCFVVYCPLFGTPYTLRGAASSNGPDGRRRAFMHGIQIVQRVVRANSEMRPRTRADWLEGVEDSLSVVDPRSRDITHYGRVWVLRLWSAMHYPIQSLRIIEKSAEAKAESQHDNTVGGAAATAAAADVKRRDSHAGSGGSSGKHDVHDGSLSSVPGAVSASQRDMPLAAEAEATQYNISLSIVEDAASAAPKMLFTEAFDTTGSSAAAAVDGAVHKLFARLQRTPAMQLLHRFLARQPQLHLPSVRTLRGSHRNTEAMEEVLQLLQRSCGRDRDTVSASVPLAQGPPIFHGVPRSLLLSAVWWTLPMYQSWTTEVLLRWLRAHASDTAEAEAVNAEAALANRRLPSTLLPIFAAYGMVSAKASAANAAPHRSRLPNEADACVPSRLAGAVGLLCRCLPPPPVDAKTAVMSATQSGTAAAVLPCATATAKLLTRDRMLPLELAHLLLMGLLLGCGPWAVCAVAMIVCADETLGWYEQAQQVVYSSRGPASPSSPPREDRAKPSLGSVDVVEAVLLTLNPTAPPLPDTMQHYAAEVTHRLRSLWDDMLSHNDAAETTAPTGPWLDHGAARKVGGEGSSSSKRSNDIATSMEWLRQIEDWDTHQTIGGHGASQATTPSSSSRVPVRVIQELRPLLQCAVTASVATRGVWVRAAMMEEAQRASLQSQQDQGATADDDPARVDGTDDDIEGSPLVFQSRQHRHFISLQVNAKDLTRVDADTSHTLSSMATCFAAFSCHVTPSASEAEEAISAADMAIKATNNREDRISNEETGQLTDEHAGVVDEGDAEEETAEEMEEVLSPDRFSRVLGTCVSPLAAAVVGAAPPSRPTDCPPSWDAVSGENTTSALQVLDEELPMLMVAFQGTVPLLVHHRGSVKVLQQVAAQLRTRIVQLRPFWDEERLLLRRLMALQVDALHEDEVDDTL